MVDFTKKVQKHGEGFEPGEQIITAAVVSPTGATMRNAIAGGVGGLVGMGIAAAVDKRRERSQESAPTTEGGLAATFPRRKAFLTVTDRRVVLHAFGEGLGRPKEVLGSYPRAQLAGCEVRPGKLVSSLQLWFADGSAVAMDLLKGGGDPARLVHVLGAPAR